MSPSANPSSIDAHSQRSHPSTSIRITRKEYMRLLSHLDREAGPQISASAPGNRRRQQRRPLHRQTHLICALADDKTHRTTRYLVRTRNISRRGLSFLHETPITKGTRCGLQVIDPQQQEWDIEGVITRSHAVAPGVYEVGIEFDYPIDHTQLSLRPQSSNVAARFDDLQQMRQRAG